MKRVACTLLLLFIHVFAFSQSDFMQVLPDSSGNEMFSDYIGVKLWAGDYALKTYGQNLNFKYQANSVFVMQHSMNIAGLKNTPNLGIGMEENLGSHLLINFVNLSLGYGQGTWNWNLGCGIGYFQALDKKKNLRLRASLNFFYEDISYSFGSYYDTTLQGFYVNGNSIGTSIRNVKYVNNIFSSNLSIDLVYRMPKFDIFFSASYNYQLYSSEKINFYYTKIKPQDAIYDSKDNTVSGNIINLGNYILQIGVIREFGL